MDKNRGFRILIADMERNVHETLGDWLEKEGFRVSSSYDQYQTLIKCRSGAFDLVILDVDLDRKEGFDICHSIRSQSDVPIVVLTKRDGERNKLKGFEAGADDYIVKPFSVPEVLVRIKTVVRRARPAHSDKGNAYIKLENLEVDMDAFQVCLDKKIIPCTSKETEILWVLLNNVGKVFSREQLLQTIWGYEYTGDTRAVDSHIKRLRAKICKKENKWNIATVWGVGYRLEKKEAL